MEIGFLVPQTAEAKAGNEEGWGEASEESVLPGDGHMLGGCLLYTSDAADDNRLV